MSTSLIQHVARQAYQTFQYIRSSTSHSLPAPCPENLQKLTNLINQLTANDVSFNQALVSDKTLYSSSDHTPPVTYVQIFENDLFTMGIFVVKNGYALPLHDHPHMYGVCKVLYGTVRVTSYQAADDDDHGERITLPEKLNDYECVLLPTSEKTTIEMTSQDHCCVLSPKEGNFHEIRALYGPAAFLDVLAPPYANSKGRRCRYYRELLTENAITWLENIPEPRDFRCAWDPYRGPPIDLLDTD